MAWLKKILGSTVGQKAIIGLTGLGLVLFLVGHLSGNLQLLLGDGGESFNAYAAWLHNLPLFPVIEIGLALLFVTHIGMTMRLTMANRASRGSRYAVNNTKRSSLAKVLASRTMAISGLIVLTFLVVHIWEFRLGHEELEKSVGGLAGGVTNELQTTWRAALYILGSLLVAFHMSHGIQSAFRSMGFNHTKFTPAIEKAGVTLAALLGLGFATIVAWLFLAR